MWLLLIRLIGCQVLAYALHPAEDSLVVVNRDVGGSYECDLLSVLWLDTATFNQMLKHAESQLGGDPSFRDDVRCCGPE